MRACSNELGRERVIVSDNEMRSIFTMPDVSVCRLMQFDTVALAVRKYRRWINALAKVSS